MQREKLALVRQGAARQNLGMSLIEIMVVVAIASMIIGGVGIVAFKRLGEARLSTAMKDAIQIQQATEMYMLQKKSKCPKTLQDLRASGAISRVIKDPWGNDYEIKCPGEHSSVDVISAGPDGEMGTEDDVANYDNEAGAEAEEE